MLYSVIVKPAAPGTTARVGGKNFSQLEATLINASELTDEIRNSSLLDVVAIAEPSTVAPSVEPNIEVDATPVIEPAEPSAAAQRRRNRH